MGDFGKLCRDILKLTEIFGNEKYVKINLPTLHHPNPKIKVYFTPKQKNKLQHIISKIDENIAESKTQKKAKLFKTREQQLDYFLRHKWRKGKYIKVIVTLLSAAHLFPEP